jgi:tRNA(fMet)-specific endonuclease VapC
MGIMLDTSVLVRAERDREQLDLGAWSQEAPVFISAITASELLTGVHRADSEARRKRRAEYVERLLEAIPVLEFGLRVARVHASIFADITKKGTPVGAHDLMIAATALSHDLAVCTCNARDFARVPELRLLPWPPRK